MTTLGQGPKSVKYFSENRGQILGLTRAEAAERFLTVQERVDTKRM